MYRMGRAARAAGVLATLALAISSCEPHRSSDDPVQPEVVGNPLAFVGELHNEALGHVLTRLQEASRAAPLTRPRALSVAEGALDAFFTHAFDRRVRTGDEIDAWRTRLGHDPTATAVELGAWMRGSAPAGDDAVELSARADEYIDRILRLTDQVDAVDSLKQRLAALEEEAAEELSGDDLDAVYATSAVAANSAEYWDLHYDEWVALCGASPGDCQDPDDAGGPAVAALSSGWKVLGADVAGAVGGFLRGGWFGAAVGAGVGSTTMIIATA